MEVSVDWQNTCPDIKSRGLYILETEKWSDCRFLVGTEPNQQIISGHKLILAMASPVFERMFYGNLPDKNDPILIPDVQPDAFRAMMEYIYSDKINISSFDKACELCYVAKKYILPHVVEECTQYLWSDLSPKNACRAYEFAKLFEEPRLMQRCMQIISTKTREVLADPSFLDIELSTLLVIFDQDELSIETELDLFNALNKYAYERGYLIVKKSNSPQLVPNQMQQQQDSLMEAQIDDESIEKTCDSAGRDSSVDDNAKVPSRKNSCSESICSQDEAQQIQNESLIKNAVKKIRFLTLTPQQFAEGPARSNLLTQSEALSILINISSPAINDCPLPEGFSSNRESRNIAFRCNDSGGLVGGIASSSINQSVAGISGIAGPSYSRHNSNTHYDCGGSNDYIPLVRQKCTRNSPPDYGAIAAGSSNLMNLHHQMPVVNPSIPNHHQPNEFINETMETRKFYCVRTIRQQMDYRNTSVTDCALTFYVDMNILITGVQVPTQVLCGELMNSTGFTERYSEILYAHLLDEQGSRLTYTHCTSRVRYDSLLEISFDHPVEIHRNKLYKIGVVFNKVGWYPIYTCSPDVICDNVHFVFNMKSPNDPLRGDNGLRSPNEPLRDGLIRAIVFTYPTYATSTTPHRYSVLEMK